MHQLKTKDEYIAISTCKLCRKWYVRIPLDLASRSMLSVGSEPIERKQIIGVLQSLSAHIASMSSTTPSANYSTQQPSAPCNTATIRRSLLTVSGRNNKEIRTKGNKQNTKLYALYFICKVVYHC